MEKLLAMNIAAILTDAALAGSNNQVPVDPELKDNTVRARNLQAWETFRVFYNAVLGALTDDQSWPPPVLPAGNLLPNLLASAAPLVTGSGALAPLVQKLIAAIPQPKAPEPIHATPLPLPGQKK
jgi:hypothetical protein